MYIVCILWFRGECACAKRQHVFSANINLQTAHVFPVGGYACVWASVSSRCVCMCVPEVFAQCVHLLLPVSSLSSLSSGSFLLSFFLPFSPLSPLLPLARLSPLSLSSLLSPLSSVSSLSSIFSLLSLLYLVYRLCLLCLVSLLSRVSPLASVFSLSLLSGIGCATPKTLPTISLSSFSTTNK